jgi:hypothetical protein
VHRGRRKPTPVRAPAGAVPDDDSWIILDGRPFLVVGYTPAGAPYGSFTDQSSSDEDWI